MRLRLPAGFGSGPRPRTRYHMWWKDVSAQSNYSWDCWRTRWGRVTQTTVMKEVFPSCFRTAEIGPFIFSASSPGGECLSVLAASSSDGCCGREQPGWWPVWRSHDEAQICSQTLVKIEKNLRSVNEARCVQPQWTEVDSSPPVACR